MSNYFFYMAGGVALLLLLYNFRSACTDFVYTATRQWTGTVFILLCMVLGTAIGAFHGSIARALPAYAPQHEAAELEMADKISACKEFVTAKLEHRADYNEPKLTVMDLIKTGAHSYWEHCAYVFGMNYWRSDIAIGAESGGRALCRAYHQDSYRSAHVESWCDTVFSPDGPL